MGKSAVIQARVDEQTKAKAVKILKQLDMSLSQAVSLFLKQIILQQGIPFEVKIPNQQDSPDNDQGVKRSGSPQGGQCGRRL